MEVQSIYGVIEITPIGRDQLYVHAPSERPVKVNGVEYSVRATFYQHPDGEWRYWRSAQDRSQSLSMMRVGSYDDPTYSARKRVCAELERLCRVFPAELLREAEDARQLRSIAAREAEIVRAREYIAALHAEVRLLKRGAREEHGVQVHGRPSTVIVTTRGKIVPTVTAEYRER